MQYTKVSETAFQQIQMNAGILVDSFAPETGVIGNILGVTTGGLSFKTNPTYEDFGDGMDNVPANTKQLKRVKSYDPVASGNFVTITAAVAKKLSGAGAISGSIHIVPSHVLKDADFSDVWIVGDYSAENVGTTTAGFVAIHIKDALNTTGFQWTTANNGKGQFAFEFHGHYDINDPDAVPYEIYVKAGTSPMGLLSVTSEAGSTSGKSKITVSGTLGTGESYVYKTAASTAPAVDYHDDVTDWTALTSGSDITPAEGHTKITVAVKNSSNLAVGSGTAPLTVAT